LFTGHPELLDDPLRSTAADPDASPTPSAR
jgi:hypothetical protein